MRHGDVEIDRKLRIATLLGTLDLVDEALKVVHPLRRILRRIGAAPQRRAKVPVIVHLAGLFIDQPRPRVIGCRRDDAAAFPTAHLLMNAEVCCRHAPCLAAATCRMAG